LKLEKSCKKGMKAKRFKAALDTDHAEKVLKLTYWAYIILTCLG